MKSKEVSTGDIFYAFNEDMHTPKVKYHLCLGTNSYFIINTKSHDYDLKITPNDCSILKHECFIKCNQLFTTPIENFEIIKVEQLSSIVIKNLIEKVKWSPTLTGIQIKEIVFELEMCLQKRNSEAKIL